VKIIDKKRECTKKKIKTIFYLNSWTVLFCYFCGSSAGGRELDLLTIQDPAGEWMSHGDRMARLIK
jgi:hypothetical protein